MGAYARRIASEVSRQVCAASLRGGFTSTAMCYVGGWPVYARSWAR